MQYLILNVFLVLAYNVIIVMQEILLMLVAAMNVLHCKYLLVELPDTNEKILSPEATEPGKLRGR